MRCPSPAHPLAHVPLRAHRCFADFKPRPFDATSAHILNNLSELVVRHLEKDIALQVGGGGGLHTHTQSWRHEWLPPATAAFCGAGNRAVLALPSQCSLWERFRALPCLMMLKQTWAYGIGWSRVWRLPDLMPRRCASTATRR